MHGVKYVSCLPKVGGFLRVLQFPPPIRQTATIWPRMLKVALNTSQSNQSNDLDKLPHYENVYCRLQYKGILLSTGEEQTTPAATVQFSWTTVLLRQSFKAASDPSQSNSIGQTQPERRPYFPSVTAWPSLGEKVHRDKLTNQPKKKGPLKQIYPILLDLIILVWSHFSFLSFTHNGRIYIICVWSSEYSFSDLDRETLPIKLTRTYFWYVHFWRRRSMFLITKFHSFFIEDFYMPLL